MLDRFQQIVIFKYKALVSIQIHLQTALPAIFPHGWCPQALLLGRDHRTGSRLPTPSQTTTQNVKGRIAHLKRFAGDMRELRVYCKVEPQLQKKTLNHEK